MKKRLNNIAVVLLTFVFLNVWTDMGAEDFRRHSYTNQIWHVRPEVVQYKKVFISGGKRYTMYYVHEGKVDIPTTKYVSEVYFVPDGYRAITGGIPGNDVTSPPWLVGIIYHDLPNGGELVGAKVKEIIAKKPGDSSNKAWLTKEIILPEDIANGLMDLVKGRTEFIVPPRGSLVRMFKGENMIYTTSPKLMKEEWISYEADSPAAKNCKPKWLK